MERHELWDISGIVEKIKIFPQTYKSILGDSYRDGTCQVLLRKKLNVLVRDGEILKTAIPGTRFGKSLYYCHNKPYYILVESERTGINIFCFRSFKKDGRYWISVQEAWQLNNDKWEYCGSKKFFDGKVLLLV